MGKTKAQHKVRFGTPPPERRDYHWADVAEQLRKKPGEWALVHTDLPSSVPWAVNAGRIAAVSKAQGFETRTVGNFKDADNKRWCRELWMRYEPESVKAARQNLKTKKNGASR